ncbi:VOC family protein [Cryptosporangium sp. NPDC051539]|uniref:VOC family protein n=1 Tax=Cryptosporangium sp. NPDC051539 TaxID=3363962 RepID=UPI0037AFE1DB
MTDPLDALRDPVPDETPDPMFAAALRLRLEQALVRPRPTRYGRPADHGPIPGRPGFIDPGFIDPDELTADELARLLDTDEIVDITLETDLEVPMTTPTSTPLRIKQFTPYLSVADGRRAIDFYVAAFGAVLIGEPVIMPDGKVGHATLQIGPIRLFLAEEFPEMGLVAPARAGGVSVTLHLSLETPDEVDAGVARAVAAGATLDREVADGPYGRAGTIIDPSGHRWFLLFEPR